MSVDTGALAIAPVGGEGPNRGGSEAIQAAYIAVLEEIVGARVDPDSHFFDDLGADSMLMTQFCARVRKRPELPRVSMKDIYRSPTIGGLVAALAAREEPAKPKPAQPSQTPEQQLAQLAQTQRQALVEVSPDPPTVRTDEPVAPVEATGAVEPEEKPKPKGRSLFWFCGTLQVAWIIGLMYLAGVAGGIGLQWVAWRSGPLDGAMRWLLSPEFYQWLVGDVAFGGVYWRAVTISGLLFALWFVLPIVVKWTLVGRWKPQEFRVWSLRYFRFWVVKSLLRASPLVAFAGTPWYSFYLRLLGARIGRNVLLLTPVPPICTDMLRIGSGTVIRRNVSIRGYRAQAGVIQTGSLTLGRNVFIGENSVLDINTEMGDDAQLGHASSLHSGQSVPAGESWHGSPGRPVETRFQRVGTDHEHWLRPYIYPAWHLATGLFGLAPLMIAAMLWLLAKLPWLAGILDPQVHVVNLRFVEEILAISLALMVAGYLLGLLALGVVPRLLNLGLRRDRSYPLYGVRYWLHGMVSTGTNIGAYTWLFGDSSYITGYLRWIGWKLRPVVQTGSNFGMDVKHATPFLSRVGTGTVVADGLSMMNAEYSSTSFRLSEVAIGAHNYLGNNIAYPAGGRTGDDCLLGTKVMIPVDGEVRQGVGLLGSPPFEIPRTVERDNRFELRDDRELKKRLRVKKRHNKVTMLLYLFAGWTRIVGLTGLGLLVFDLLPVLGALVVALGGLPALVFFYGHVVLVERAVSRFQMQVPAGCSIYDEAFWRHERYWKVSRIAPIKAFDGTPLKSLLWRLLGVRIGRRVFDDGCHITERGFTTVGDNCTLNAGSVLQCHSQEDGAFKSDTIVVTDDVTLGVGAFVHYGVTVGYGSTIEADSFLMKGEEVPAETRWAGNPATEVRPDGVPITGGWAPLAQSGGMAPAVPKQTSADPWRPQPKPRVRAKSARPDLAVAEAIGSVVWDADGHPFLDFCTEPGNRLLGHNHPEIAKARTPHPYWCVDQQAAVKMTKGAFIESQRSMVPEPMRWRTRMRFCAATEDPVSVALDLCRDATGRRDVAVLHADAGPEVVESTLRAVQHPAALLMTLTRGTRLASPELVRRAREVTRQMRIPLVLDETETGGGRTGTWFAFERYGIEPDAVISSTSVTNEAGDPLDVVLYDARLEPRGGHPPELPAGHTALFAEACSVVIARRDDVLANVRARGAQLGELLGDLREHPAVAEVAGAGLLWGVRFADPGDGRTAASVAADVRDFAFRAGLIVRHDGPEDGLVRLQPPLTVAGEVVDVAASILRFAIEAAYVMSGDRRALTGRTSGGSASRGGAASGGAAAGGAATDGAERSPA